jgi:hypothetical protein
MQRKKIVPGVATLLLLLLSNCGRIIDWGKSNFYQGEDVVLYDEKVAPYIKNVTIYDQLDTKAHFSAMWLSDPIRTAYAQLHTKRMGKDEAQYKTFLRRQLEENNHYITFYVLSTHEVKLGVPESYWSLFLRANGKDYMPFELKEVELPTEYQQFFGKYWNRFKVPYVVKFRLVDENEDVIISDQTEFISLFVRSADKEHAFIWNLYEQQESVPVVQPAPIKRKKRR